MKKIFTLLALCMTTVLVSNAQTTFSVSLVTPANNSTHVNGNNLAESAIVTVTGGSVSPTDTIAFGDPIIGQNSQVYIRTGQTKAVNDTMIFNYSYNGVSGQNGAQQWCVSSFLFSAGSFASNFDTTGGTWRTCNTVNFSGDPFGVSDFTFKENTPKKLTIYPNPATGNIVNMNFVAANAKEVTVNVFDLAGRKVISQSFDSAYKGKGDFNLDISSLNQGMYIMEVKQDGMKATGQFTK